MPQPVFEILAKFAVSLSAQVVVIAVLSAGIAIVVSQTEQMLVLGLIAAYLATAILLASLTAPELAVAVALIGIFVSLTMQFTAAEVRQMPQGDGGDMPVTFRLLMVLALLWLAWSLDLFARPLDASRFAVIWLLACSLVALATSTNPFKVGTSLLLLLSAGLLYYATSTAEASLLVLGIIAVASFAVSLTTSHLALGQDAPGTRGQDAPGTRGPDAPGTRAPAASRIRGEDVPAAGIPGVHHDDAPALRGVGEAVGGGDGH